MLTYWLWIIASLVLLYFGAEGLVRGSSSLALRLGLTPLVVGLTVVAMGTSMPEVMVSVKAALAGRGDLAVGNVVGSNIFNIGVILALTALLSPMKVQFQLIKIDAPIMVAVSLGLVAILWDGAVGRLAGAALFGGLIVYIAGNIWLARRTATKQVENEYAEGVPARSGSLLLDGLFILGGLGILVI
jgi:cation:H+ antiporter